MPLGITVPALPVGAMAPAIDCYTARFGFATVFADASYAVLRRDAAVLHLWLADDARWTDRTDLAQRPVRSGAESFLAGTASCRIEVDTVAELEELFTSYAASGILHPVNRGGTTTSDFGTQEFATLDRDGNLLTFYVWLPPA